MQQPETLPPDEFDETADGLPTSDNQDLEALACVSCRARKLKCDRTKPSCTRCTKINNDCAYPESRRKPTFKRKNVKELEARLAQVEDYLKEVVKNTGDNGEDMDVSPPVPDWPSEADNSGSTPRQMRDESHKPSMEPSFTFGVNDGSYMFNDAQLMDLGLSESLPPFEIMEELNSIYFAVHHFYMPIIHPGRYLQAFYSGPLKKPPMCLQYSIWAMAAYTHDKYGDYADIFYQRARQYVDADEMKGSGEHFITLFHAQAYALLAGFEARCTLFTRAAMTSAKCVRLVQMMGLDRLDGEQDSIPPMLAPTVTWLELEERRRIFWGAFAIDSHASISTGWPSLIVSDDVTTRLPASEDAFLFGKEEKSSYLEEVFRGASYTGFASAIVICRIFKAIMHHVHRSRPSDRPEDLVDGPYWTRHRKLDNELSSAFMFLPEELRLPQHMKEPAAMNINMNLHASVICLHHAAIEKVDKHGLSDVVKNNSLSRLRTAADEVVNIIKMSSSSAAAFKNPLCALSLYCSATVYIYFAKNDPGGLTSVYQANLETIISAMESIGRSHEITRAFLQQACLDIERNNLGNVLNLPNLTKYRDLFGGPCSNIPMLARNSIANHTEISPVLPGKLPLGNPQGTTRSKSSRFTKPNYVGELHAPTMDPMPPIPDLLGGVNYYANISGAATRNIGTSLHAGSLNQHQQDKPQSSKRKRPSPEDGFGILSKISIPDETDFSAEQQKAEQNSCIFPSLRGTNILPDRGSNSTGSSPLNRVATETQSGSSSTSPAMFGGLGNTPAENRVDLRAFQDRIATPIWDATESDLLGDYTAQWDQLSANENYDKWESWMGVS